MKKLLLALFISFLSFSAFSQQWFPLGATWHYGYMDYIYEGAQNYYPKIYFVEKDTIVLGHSCKKIINANDNSDYSYRYANSDSVFYLLKSDTVWNLLFDFSAQAGDTIFYPQFDSLFGYGHFDPKGYNVVGGTGTIVVNSDTLRTYFCSDFNSGGGLSEQGEFAPFAIERISGGNVFRHWEVILGTFHFDYALGLRCYQDNEIGFYKDPNFSSSCDTAYSYNVGLKEDFFSISEIYPNPADAYFVIKSAEDIDLDYEVQLMNLNGKLILESSIHSQDQKIDVSHLEAGIYLLRLRNEESTRTQKLIIE